MNANPTMTITGDGSVGIGTTSPGEKLDVAGNVRATAFYYSSDARLKTNIATAPGLALITQLHGVSYNWKESGQRGLGLLAQEVEPVLPELVATNPDTGLKSVNYGHLVGPMVEAIKELHTTVAELRAALDRLQDAVREQRKP